MVNQGHLPDSDPEPGNPRPPHPVNALRLTQYVSHCKVCGAPTPYICARCATRATYCSPAHLLKVCACVSFAVGSGTCVSIPYITLVLSICHACHAQDWDSHWRECDGSGGTTPAEALEQCMEFMAGRFERGLSQAWSVNAKEELGRRKKGGGDRLLPVASPSEGVGVVRRPIER